MNTPQKKEDVPLPFGPNTRGRDEPPMAPSSISTQEQPPAGSPALKRSLPDGERPEKGATSPTVAAVAIPADLRNLVDGTVKPEGMDDFKWHDNDGVVARSYGSIAVYTNAYGDLVIRQENFSYGGRQDDIVVAIPRAQVEDVILAMQNNQRENDYGT